MTILAFDTASSACSAAVWRDGAVVSRRFEAMERGHAETLVPMIVEVLADAGIGFADIDALAVTIGPGSFTGLRAGLAAARGLALARRLPVAGVTSLEAVAYGVSPGAVGDAAAARARLVALSTRRADVYVQLFAADLAPLTEPAAMMPGDVPALVGDRPVLVAGDGAASLRGPLSQSGVEAAFDDGPGVPDAATVAAIAARRHGDGDRGEALSRGPPEPLYLHPPQATVPPGGGSLRP